MATNGMPGEGLRIEVGEHVYITPPVPPKENMLFFNEKKKDQYWRRQADLPDLFYLWHEDVEIDAEYTEYYDDKTLKSLSKTDTDELLHYRDRELSRRKEGVWFLNNGEPCYITGDHYFALQWGAMLGCDNDVEPGSKYGQYYEFQRNDIFYYFEICEHTSVGLGGILVKPKKTGATQCLSLIILNRGTMMEQKVLRMMNIKEDDAKEVNFNLIIYALSKMPGILSPSKSKDNLTDITFGPPPEKGKKARMKQRVAGAGYLHTKMATVPTASTGFDLITNFIALIDEFPKIIGENIEDIVAAAKVGVKEGVKRKGTIFMMSYVPESNNVNTPRCKKLYFDSELSTIADGQRSTTSELICHTLTTEKGLTGCCDKYGKPDEAKIWAYYNEQIDKCKGDEKKIQAVKRQYPMNKNDPWLEGWGGDTIFRNLAFDKQRQDISIMQAKGLLMYEEFNLYFSIKPTIDDVKQEYKFPGYIRYIGITDDQIRSGKHGKFKWFKKEWIPDGILAKNINSFTINKKNGKLAPNPNSAFYGVIDPANYAISRNVVVGSKNAMQIILLPDATIDAFCNVRNSSFKRTMVSYLFREEKPSNTLLDAVSMILYFSCYFLIECNTPWLFNRLVEMGFENFLIVRNMVTGIFEPYNAYKMISGEQKMYNSQKNAQVNDIDYYTKAAQDHYGEPLTIEDPDNIRLEYDTNIIDQSIKFNKEDTRPFDAAVCRYTGLMGVNSYLGWMQKESTKQQKTYGSMKEIFQEMENF